MRVVFLDEALRDLEWFRRYYRSVFPDGSAGARARFRKALANLQKYPRMGPAMEGSEFRSHPIARTPFRIVYRIADDTIEIARIRDQRAGFPELTLPDLGSSD
jgi:plasmid stabilization system protein ParE